jgi:hypothetical protein
MNDRGTLDARGTLDTMKAAVYGGVDQSWKVSWAPHVLPRSMASAPMAMSAAMSFFIFYFKSTFF